jgi:uncharacterized membrane protein YbhN (UPF0104 family)
MRGRAGAGWRRWLGAALTLAVLALLAAFLLEHRAYIADHYAARPGDLLAIAGLVVATLVARSLAHQELYRRLGIRVSTWDWIRLVGVTSYANYLPLSFGMVAKGYFLKRVHALPYGTFVLSQGAMLAMIISTNGVVGLATLGIGLPEHVVGVVGAGFALMSLSAPLLLLPASMLRRLTGRRLPWNADDLPALRRAWPAVAFWQLVNLLATAAGLAVAFSLGASTVGFSACLVFSSAAMLTRLVAVTPGAIGIREFLIGGLAYITGFDLRDAVIASTVTRTVEIVVVFALGGAFTHRLSNQLLASYSDHPED